MRYEQRSDTAPGLVVARFYRPEPGRDGLKLRPAGHRLLYGHANDAYGKMRVGDARQFTGTTVIVRIA